MKLYISISVVIKKTTANGWMDDESAGVIFLQKLYKFYSHDSLSTVCSISCLIYSRGLYKQISV